jgi:hypothetical protein
MGITHQWSRVFCSPSLTKFPDPVSQFGLLTEHCSDLHEWPGIIRLSSLANFPGPASWFDLLVKQHSGLHKAKCQPQGRHLVICARGKSRTYDRPSISRVLYQLSYACLVELKDSTRNPQRLPVLHVPFKLA